jgi:signal transduction histidine kinase
MNAIIGFSSLLTLEELSEENNRYARQIYTNSESLLTLIEDIMDLSKIEAGQLEIRKGDVELGQLIKEVYEVFFTESQKVENYSINYVYNIPEQEFIVNADAIRVKQIMSNLLSNAFKFTDKGVVEVGYHIDNNESAVLFVRDTGIGIAQEHLASIFERFKKIEKDRIRLYRGAGLGLSIVKQLADLMGGQLIVESEEGKGSCFKFVLPLNA